MAVKNFKQESRKDWGKQTSSESEQLTAFDLQLGAIFRIADAIEKMAQRHTDLIRRNEYLDGYVKLLELSRRTKDRQINALRGHLNRMKKAMK